MQANNHPLKATYCCTSNKNNSKFRLKNSFLMMGFLFASFLAITPSFAFADGTANWLAGNKKDARCVAGAHWVLTPSQGITGADLYLGDTKLGAMEQNGDGSWSFDTTAAVLSTDNYYAKYFGTYTGPKKDKPSIKLSHCLCPSDCVEDNNVCNGITQCLPDGTCATGNPLECGASDQCADRGCDAQTGCYENDTSGRCGASDQCADRGCDAQAGCYENDTSARCGASDQCADRGCDAQAGCYENDTSARCNDHEICTDDTCDAQSGCVYTRDDTNDQSCVPPGPTGCRVTGGGFLDGTQLVESTKATFGGQVGAPCGCAGCYPFGDPGKKDNNPQGNWVHTRHNKGGSITSQLKAGEFNSLTCGCEDGSGIDPVTGLCNPDDREAGPEPRKAPANTICFTGIATYDSGKGKTATSKPAAFRTEIKDSGEPGGSNDTYVTRIWVVDSVEAAQNIASAACCASYTSSELNAAITAGTVAQPTIVDGDPDLLTKGNLQIHPELPNTEAGNCPIAEESVCLNH